MIRMLSSCFGHGTKVHYLFRLSLNGSLVTYILCDHEWSFLEGAKKHSHTLKAGRHFFPFQLQIGGSLPSSIATAAIGGASVSYKLRALAVRPGLNHNLQAVLPVSIVRSFATEALEYQQTLEIENTWPDKLMYSILIPHKAWAAGDTLTALVKFSPLAKGVRVVSVATAVHQTTKIYCRSGGQDASRVVASTKHFIVNGKAVEQHEHELRSRYTHSLTPSPSSPSTPAASTPGYGSMSSGGNYFSLPRSSNTPPLLPEAGPSTAHHETEIPADMERSEADVVTYINLDIPLSITPTHGLEPIIVTHRIRWSILIMNLDGHSSELRCSLPLHLLDRRLFQESRRHTAATRRLLIGGPEVPPPEEEDMELPSYTAHVRDRIANMFLPEAATVRVTNPWMQGTDTAGPALVGGGQIPMSAWLNSYPGQATPLETHVLSHLPHAPGSGDSTPLDWVNSELLLSVGQSAHSEDSNSDSTPASRVESQLSSSRPSRLTSRAPSPERLSEPGTSSPSFSVSGPNESYVHSGNASRNLPSVFNASMKPFTSLSHPTWLPSRTNLSSLAPLPSSSESSASRQPIRSRTLTLDRNATSATMQRAYNEVPDYGAAARGFIGGIPPLTSMRGLPSYEEAARSQSESDLLLRFRHAVGSQSLPTTPRL